MSFNLYGFFYGYFKDVSFFQAYFEEVERIFQGCFKGIQKEVSRVAHGNFKLFQGSFNNVLGVFQRPLQEVSKDLQRKLNIS